VTRISEVESQDGYHVRLTFTDGTSRIVDLSPYMNGPILEPLRDPTEFRRVRVDPGLGTIVWPNGADICPDVLYHGRTPASMEEHPSS